MLISNHQWEVQHLPIFNPRASCSLNALGGGTFSPSKSCVLGPHSIQMLMETRLLSKIGMGDTEVELQLAHHKTEVWAASPTTFMIYPL